MDMFSLFDHVLEYEPEREPERSSSRLPQTLEKEPPTPALPASPKSAAPVLDPLQRRILERELTRSQASPSVKRERPSKQDPAVEVGSRRAERHVRARQLEVPRAQRRGNRRDQRSLTIGLRVRPEERQLLTEVGKFRVVSTDDLARVVYKGNGNQMESDLRFLKSKRLVEVHVLNARRDGRREDVRRFEAVTLTPTAKRLLERSGDVPDGQQLYAGLVKASEAEHDAQIYRAYLKELAHIEKEGGQNPRVRLDFELKAAVQRALYKARKAVPERDLSDIKAEIARDFELTVSRDKIVIPDARIEYELPTGGSAHVDIEVATSAYRRNHIASKTQAGFKLYISRGDIGNLGPAIQDDHDLMSQIFDF